MKRPNGGHFFVLYEVGYTARFTKRKRGIMRRHYWYRTPLRWRAAGAAPVQAPKVNQPGRADPDAEWVDRMTDRDDGTGTADSSWRPNPTGFLWNPDRSNSDFDSQGES